MAQEGPRGHQGTDASNGKGIGSPATDSGTLLSPGENTNSGSWTAIIIPVAEDASNKGKDVQELVPTGSSHSKGKRKVAASGDGGRGAGGMEEPPHITTERKRRERTKGLYDDLHALLPHVPEKTDRATIVGEAISFIKLLEDTVAKLEKRKQDLALARRAAVAAAASSSAAAPPNAAQGLSDLPEGWAWQPKQEPAAALPPLPPVGFQTWSRTNVVLSVSNDDAFISVCAPRRAGALLMVLSVLEKHCLDVVTAQVASDGDRSMLSIHARVNAAAIQQLFGEPPAPEDIYKLAVSEIMHWLST